MKHLLNLVQCLVALVGAHAGASAAEAEKSRFSTADLSVVTGSHVVAVGKSTSFKVGEELAFMKVPAFPFMEKLTARIFPLQPGSDIPASWAEFTPCIVFWSTLRPVSFSASGQIKFFTLTEGWLEAASNGTVSGRRYLVVFEQGDGDGLSMVRLHRDDVKAYFSRGTAFVIEPERSYSKDQGRSMAALQANSSAQATQLAKRNVPEFWCYRVKTVAGTTPDLEGDALFALNDCEADVPTP